MSEQSPHARKSDPGTSQEAAFRLGLREGEPFQVRPKSTRHLALHTIYRAREPVSARETGRRADHDGLWKRVSDLHQAGFVECVGTIIDPETKHQARLFIPTEAGVAALRRLAAGETIKVER